jgi:diguanylate cyclase (GGDEF)-like protein
VEHARTDAALRRAYDELWQANSDLMREVGERTRAEAKLSHLALYDTLTGLPNRALFLDRLNHALTRSDRSHRGMGVMFLDLDNFKTVNDTLGHDFGDDLLKLVAARLRTAIRAGDTVARFGGDEFTILLESLNDRADAVTVAQRIVEIIREPAELGTTEFVPSFSIGIAFGVSGRDQSDVLLRHADLAMYRAKTSGKGCFEVFDPSMTTSAKERLEMEVDLRRALERHELRVHYQPIVSLKTGKIVAMEALTRWEHSERGMVDPSQFIPVAEETGLIVPLGQWVLGEACRQIKRWQIVNPEAGQLMVAINLAARQFQHPHLVQEIEAILRETGLDPACLQLEVSETAVMKDVEATIRRLNALKALGVKLAIDDLGTGYSSLAYLRQFPVDTLKIDRSFVGGLGREVHDSEVVRRVVTMAKNLSLAITSEGIETVEQLSQLVALGCDRAQGYYFSAAVRPESLTASLWHEVEGRLFSTPRGKANVA